LAGVILRSFVDNINIDVRDVVLGGSLMETSSGLCLIMGLGIVSVELSDSVVEMQVNVTIIMSKFLVCILRSDCWIMRR
jgi:hypothetical protein